MLIFAEVCPDCMRNKLPINWKMSIIIYESNIPYEVREHTYSLVTHCNRSAEKKTNKNKTHIWHNLNVRGGNFHLFSSSRKICVDFLLWYSIRQTSFIERARTHIFDFDRINIRRISSSCQDEMKNIRHHYHLSEPASVWALCVWVDCYRINQAIGRIFFQRCCPSSFSTKSCHNIFNFVDLYCNCNCVGPGRHSNKIHGFDGVSCGSGIRSAMQLICEWYE